ncbi:MAG: hypothetical protein LBL30_03230 [Holosporales bacterium]|jgi:phage/plasmid primase-like uncharacterized protein|nr:hypothetical protein [Holosporales bacterium]
MQLVPAEYLQDINNLLQLTKKGRHPYLEEKGLHNIDVEVCEREFIFFNKLTIPAGSLIIPCYDFNLERRNIQYILPYKNKEGEFEKKFLFNLPFMNLFALIKGGAPNSTVLCEGYATGLTINLLLNWPVMVALNCHNLVNVCAGIKGAYKACKKSQPRISPSLHFCSKDIVFIFADSDDNGIKNAEKTKFPYIHVPFTEEDKLAFKELKGDSSRNPTDINDYYQLYGDKRARRLVAALAKEKFGVALNIETTSPETSTIEEPSFESVLNESSEEYSFDDVLNNTLSETSESSVANLKESAQTLLVLSEENSTDSSGKDNEPSKDTYFSKDASLPEIIKLLLSRCSTQQTHPYLKSRGLEPHNCKVLQEDLCMNGQLILPKGILVVEYFDFTLTNSLVNDKYWGIELFSHLSEDGINFPSTKLQFGNGKGHGFFSIPENASFPLGEEQQETVKRRIYCEGFANALTVSRVIGSEVICLSDYRHIYKQRRREGEVFLSCTEGAQIDAGRKFQSIPIYIHFDSKELRIFESLFPSPPRAKDINDYYITFGQNKTRNVLTALIEKIS